MTDRMVSGGELTPEQRRVHRVEHILRRDGGSPGSALDGLAAIIEDGTWRKVPSGSSTPEPFRSFTAFVEGAAPYGLGYSIRQLRALLKLSHPDEEKSTDVHERMEAMRKEVERLLGEEIPKVRNVPGRPPNDSTTAIRPSRETAGAVIAKLKRHDPALAQQVINGEVTPNAAARAKGWRKPRIVVSSPERTAVSLRKYMSPEQLAELARLIAEEG